MASIQFNLNGKPQTVDTNPAMPLLWVLRDLLGPTGTKFGCGMALCRACTVHVNGVAVGLVYYARFFREDWKKKAGLTANEDHQLTQDDVANPSLELRLYGDKNNLTEVFQAPIDVVMLWTGHCSSNCAVALRDRNNYVDLTGLAKIRWRTRQPGFHYLHPIVKLADGTWLIGEHTDGYTVDWNVREFSFYDMHWRRLDIDHVVEARDGQWVDKADLSKVDEVGFTDLMIDLGPGQGGSSRIDWIEVYGKPVSREASATRASAQASY